LARADAPSSLIAPSAAPEPMPEAWEEDVAGRIGSTINELVTES